MGLLRTLLILVLAYFLLKIVRRLFTNSGRQNRSTSEFKSRKKNSSKGENEGLGEYVDFEEIDDK